MACESLPQKTKNLRKSRDVNHPQNQGVKCESPRERTLVTPGNENRREKTENRGDQKGRRHSTAGEPRTVRIAKGEMGILENRKRKGGIFLFSSAKGRREYRGMPSDTGRNMDKAPGT
jgi:hypothetical protein